MLLFLVVLITTAIANLSGVLLDTVLSCSVKLKNSSFIPHNAHRKSSRGKTRMEAFIMAYNSVPYVEMTLKEKMVATLKVHNDMLEMSALD